MRWQVVRQRRHHAGVRAIYPAAACVVSVALHLGRPKHQKAALAATWAAAQAQSPGIRKGDDQCGRLAEVLQVRMAVDHAQRIDHGLLPRQPAADQGVFAPQVVGFHHDDQPIFTVLLQRRPQVAAA